MRYVLIASNGKVSLFEKTNGYFPSTINQWPV